MGHSRRFDQAETVTIFFHSSILWMTTKKWHTKFQISLKISLAATVEIVGA